MSNYFENMTPVEYMEAAVRISNNKLTHLSYEFNKIMLEHEQHMLDIESKVFLEYGTNEDFQYLMEAEDGETKKESTGILGGILSAVGAIFKAIKKFLFGEKDEEATEDVVVSDDPDELVATTKKEKNKLVSIISDNKGAIAATALGVIGGAVATKVLAPQVKSVRVKITDAAEDVEQTLDDVKDKIDDLPPEQQKEAKQQLTVMQKLGNRLMKVSKDLSDSIKDILPTEANRNKKFNEAQDKSKVASDSAAAIEEEIRKDKMKIRDLQKKIEKTSKVGPINTFAKKQKRYDELVSMRFRTAAENKELVNLRKEKDALGHSELEKQISEINRRILDNTKRLEEFNKSASKADKVISRAISRDTKKEARNTAKMAREEAKVAGRIKK